MPELSNFEIPTPETITQLPPELRAEAAVAFMADFEPGFLPRPLFLRMAQLAVIATAEIALLRTNAHGETQILLHQRDTNPESQDPWAGQLHVAGRIALATDRLGDDELGFEGSIDNVMQKELGGIAIVGELHFLEAQRRRGMRGDELTARFWGEADIAEDETPPTGAFYDVEDVLRDPSDLKLIESHTGIVERAAAVYEDHRRRLVRLI